jgi:ribosome biogenesis protein Nip4
MNDIHSFVKTFTSQKLDHIVQVRRNFFQASDELMSMKNKIGKEPFAIGTYMGSGKPFHPSIALLDWLGSRTERFVVLDKKASWLFLCGRDVFANSIIKKNVSEGPVLVKNQLGEALGYGEFTSGKRKIAIKNLLDRGDFLRRER